MLVGGSLIVVETLEQHRLPVQLTSCTKLELVGKAKVNLDICLFMPARKPPQAQALFLN